MPLASTSYWRLIQKADVCCGKNFNGFGGRAWQDLHVRIVRVVRNVTNDPNARTIYCLRIITVSWPWLLEVELPLTVASTPAVTSEAIWNRCDPAGNDKLTPKDQLPGIIPTPLRFIATTLRQPPSATNPPSTNNATSRVADDPLGNPAAVSAPPSLLTKTLLFAGISSVTSKPGTTTQAAGADARARLAFPKTVVAF